MAKTLLLRTRLRRLGILLLCTGLVAACVAIEEPPQATEVPQTGPTRQLLLSQLPCPPARPQGRPRRPPPPGGGVEQEWLQRMCALQIQPAVTSSDLLGIGEGETASMIFSETWVRHFPGLVDSNSPAFWDGSTVVVFNSTYWPQRAEGSSVETLGAAADIELRDQVDSGGHWIEAVWRDESTGTLYGWYHHEPDNLECLTAPTIGAAISTDGGHTWLDKGPVLTNPYPINCNYENGYFSGGNGDPSVILDTERRYFYFLYSNYNGPLSEQGIGVARSEFADKGQPGTVFKFDGTGWSRPGLSGLTTPIFPATTSWRGPDTDAFWGLSVHWNTYLNRYVGLLNHTEGTGFAQEGIYVSFSSDLVNWTQPVRIMDASTWYPQVVGLGTGETDTLAGQTVRFYVAGISAYILTFEK